MFAIFGATTLDNITTNRYMLKFNDLKNSVKYIQSKQ